MALLTWETPTDCSLEAVATSWTSSAVFRIDGTKSLSTVPERSAIRTLRSGERADLLGGLLTSFGELSHFGGDHGESFAMFAGARRFDGGVQSEEVGLVSDFLDDGNFLGDGIHRIDRFGDGFATLFHFTGALECHLFHLFTVVGVLRDRRIHLLETSAGFLDRSGLFAGALREHLRRGTQPASTRRRYHPRPT